VRRRSLMPRNDERPIAMGGRKAETCSSKDQVNRLGRRGQV
jgi:hypothetical protein